MRSFNKLVNKKRAISPVIAVILLIGLAVAAAAAIFLIVIPLFQASSNLEMEEAYVIYDDKYTTAADLEKGYGKAILVLSNAGTADIDIVSVKVYYALDILGLGSGTEITNHTGLLISENNPYTIKKITTLEELPIQFLIPDENDDNTVFYRVVITTSEGEELDTATTDSVDETEMDLTKDRPDISYSGSSLGFLRREEPIRPSQIRDNSEIKNVTYEIHFENGTLIPDKTKTIEPPNTLWQWTWDTRNDTTEGLDNGTYKMRMTVYDYAGLSDETDLIPFTIDNDYISPTIADIIGSSVENGEGIAEVGSSFSISAQITDSGCSVSAIDSAYVFYKLNDSSTTYSSSSLSKGIGNMWTGNIPGPFLDSDALVNNITYYLVANDDDANEETSVDQFAIVIDTTEPNFDSHVFEDEPVIAQDPLEGTEGKTLRVDVTVTDKDVVSTVKLYWRERNDTQIPTQYGSWKLTTNISGIGNVWNFRIPALNVTLDGLEYFLNATDPYNNTAWEGTPTSPYRIMVPDEIAPIIDIQSTMPSSITEGTNLVVTAAITDNDPSFSWIGFETGTVKLTVILPVLPDPEYDMIHISGDSSKGETPLWDLTVLGGNFSTSYSPVTIRIQAIDQNGKTILLDHSITVMDAGLPLLTYVDDSVSISGADNHILSFNIKNDATQPAKATITDIQVLLQSNGKIISSGEPYITQIDESGTVWTNSTPSEGANGTKITLSSTFDLTMGSTTTLQLTYANSTGGNYDLYDLTVTVTLYYNYPVSQSGQKTLTSFNTPVTQLTPTTETRYMRSGTATVNGLTAYYFGTDLTGSIHLSDATNTYSSDLGCTWGMQVYILHADSSQTSISGGIVATVQRTSGGDAEGMQSNSWNCPETPLATTDAIVVEIWGQVGGNSPELHAEFVTNQLGAERLDTATWIVYYYTQRDRSGGFFSRRTTAYFHWGEGIYNSRIEGIKHSSAGGGGGGAAIQSVYTISDNLLATNPTTPLLIWVTEINYCNYRKQ